MHTEVQLISPPAFRVLVKLFPKQTHFSEHDQCACAGNTDSIACKNFFTSAGEL